MSVTRYRFRQAVSAFFEVPATFATACLRGRGAPIEVSHGLGVLAVTAFDFVASEVGPYRELVLSILTPPAITAGREWPRAAFFPFIVGTSSDVSRTHGLTRWHLPHYPREIDLVFRVATDRVLVGAHEAGRPILDLEVSGHAWRQAWQPYQLHSSTADGVFRADIGMEGMASEHEEETGRLALHDHPFCADLVEVDLPSRPFREIWLRDGVQSIAPQTPTASCRGGEMVSLSADPPAGGSGTTPRPRWWRGVPH